MFWKPKSTPSSAAEDSAENPFQVVIRQSPAESEGGEEDTALRAISGSSEDLALEEIEAAYLKALETAEAAEDWHLPEGFITEGADQAAESTAETQQASTEQTLPDSAATAGAAVTVEKADEQNIEAWQVIEALLFVGGDPLPAKRMLEVLGNRFTQEQLDEILDALSRRYAEQQRPYQVLLIEGGYCLRLRDEFESIRGKVYGHGPKEVKLAQEALEILALIAYQQPITREQIEETERPNIPGLLRQLLRRQLIVLERKESGESQQYRTTPRFLDLFGLKSLADLPQAVDFSFK